MTINKQSLVSKQVFIVLYLAVAAISCIEAAAQYKIGGWGNWRFYFFAILCISAVVLYFKSKNKRFEDKGKP